jgi:hypothetical protein
VLQAFPLFALLDDCSEETKLLSTLTDGISPLGAAGLDLSSCFFKF